MSSSVSRRSRHRMLKLIVSAGAFLGCMSCYAQQPQNYPLSSDKKSIDVDLKGLHVRLGDPIQVTAQLGWRVSTFNFDRFAFIHLTPTLGKFPNGELIATYTLDPDTQANPYFLSGFQISKDRGEHWGTRYATLIQHIPMTFIPAANNSLIALPSELLGGREGNQNLHGPYVKFEQGGEKVSMEPDGVRVVDWPWPVSENHSLQPEANWHYSLLMSGDAIRVHGKILATAYWHRKDEKYFGNGLLSSDDEGHTWHYYSTIATDADMPAETRALKGYGGPDEISMIRLAEGELMAVFRVGNGTEGKLWRSYSKDDGRTWTKPDQLPAYCVQPRVVQTANGTIVVASGRPGIGLWFSTDPRGRSWQYIDLAAVHNNFMSDASYRILPTQPEHPENIWWQTTSYTGLVEVANNRLLLIYDRDPEKAPSGPNDLSRIFAMPIEIVRK